MIMKKKSIDRLFDDAIDDLDITYDEYFEIERFRPRSVHIVHRLLPNGIRDRKVLVLCSNEIPFSMLFQKVGFHVENFYSSGTENDEKENVRETGDAMIQMIRKLKSVYDVICCDDILQILESPSEVLKCLKKKLRPGGVLTISTPNVARCITRLRLLAGRNVYPWPGDHFSGEENFEGHNKRLMPYREYTLRELEMLLNSNGFELMQSEFIIGKSVNANMWPPMPVKEYFLQKIFIVIQKLAAPLRSYLYVAGQKPV
jgi:SAM-dependent methyltransferase